MTQDAPDIPPDSEDTRDKSVSRRGRYVLWAIYLLIAVGIVLFLMWNSIIVDHFPSPLDSVTTYHCDSCGHEFDKSFPPLPASAPASAPDLTMGPFAIRCAKCGKTESWLMNRCYRCKKLFAAKPEEHKRDYDGSKTVCPHCGTNQLEYLKEKLKQ